MAQSAPVTIQQATQLEAALRRIIRGKDEVVRLALVAILARGHLLIEGVPGVGKTTLAQALARAIDCDFQRVQFTSDMLPSDVLGVTIYNAHSEVFEFKPGPIFSNFLLADEINRTTPKTQSALLEAMQEQQVSVARDRHRLPPPFFVLATQNPLEMEGTYPLPEAQLDRFMLELRVSYPSRVEEEAIVEQTTGTSRVSLHPVLDAGSVLAMQALVRRIPVSRGLIRSAVSLARMTRPGDAEAPGFIKEYVEWGAGPRASQYLVLGAKARAAIAGRPMADLDDVRAVASSVLRHRLVTNFAAEAADRTSEHLVRELVGGKAWLGG
jgi:MoxR-like ATPase